MAPEEEEDWKGGEFVCQIEDTVVCESHSERVVPTCTGNGCGGNVELLIILMVVGPRRMVSLPSKNCMDTDSPVNRNDTPSQLTTLYEVAHSSVSMGE